jgi:hypothetical protein
MVGGDPAGLTFRRSSPTIRAPVERYKLLIERRSLSAARRDTSTSCGRRLSIWKAVFRIAGIHRPGGAPG